MEGEEFLAPTNERRTQPLDWKGIHIGKSVNFSHPRVSHIIANSNVNIEEHVVDQIMEDVEVLETQCH
jgi:hypothetical protein